MMATQMITQHIQIQTNLKTTKKQKHTNIFLLLNVISAN